MLKSIIIDQDAPGSQEAVHKKLAKDKVFELFEKTFTHIRSARES